MARIQVLALPSTHDDEAPFVLVVDQVDPEGAEHLFGDPDSLTRFRDMCGARAILVTEGVLDAI
jgi:hypothetical protein